MILGAVLLTFTSFLKKTRPGDRLLHPQCHRRHLMLVSLGLIDGSWVHDRGHSTAGGVFLISVFSCCHRQPIPLASRLLENRLTPPRKAVLGSPLSIFSGASPFANVTGSSWVSSPS